MNPPSPIGKASFSKTWKSCIEQVEILESRGLLVTDRQAAADFLAHINYYRFSGYCLAFESSRHVLLPGTRFEDICAAYQFDLRIRDLFNEALEVAEVDIRTAVAHSFGRTYGPFGHTDSRSFHGTFNHVGWLQRLRVQARESREPFVLHFARTYREFPDLPIWMLTEIMSFGSLSLMFKFMHEKDRRAIGARYAVQPTYLASWLHHLVYVRNLCAHHARLWDRVWAIKPSLPTSQDWASARPPSNDRLFTSLLILHQLMKRCPCLGAFRLEWVARVASLFKDAPACPDPLARMGLPPTWRSHPLWQV